MTQNLCKALSSILYFTKHLASETVGHVAKVIVMYTTTKIDNTLIGCFPWDCSCSKVKDVGIWSFKYSDCLGASKQIRNNMLKMNLSNWKIEACNWLSLN